MVYGFSFECPDCKWAAVLVNGGDAWVDEQGNFGYALHPGYEIIGTPQGLWDRMYYDKALCITCCKTFILLIWKPKWLIHRHQHPKDFEPVEVISGESKGEENSADSIMESSYFTRCPDCGSELLGGKDMMKKVRGREKSNSFKMPPLPPNSPAQKCPRCKKVELVFLGVLIS
jgi:hypothetical protein